MWHTNCGDRTLEGAEARLFAEAQAAIAALDGKKCDGYTVKVNEAKTQG